VLRRIALRDFVIVPALELDFHAGFSVLTGETGAGKSILVDALQLALGSSLQRAPLSSRGVTSMGPSRSLRMCSWGVVLRAGLSPNSDGVTGRSCIVL